MRFFVIVIAIPLIEIAGFVLVGGWIGLWLTLALVIAAAAGGVMLLRAQGLSAARDLQAALGQGRDPLSLVADNALVLLAALLLIVPGFFGDLVALALLLPPLRRAILRGLERRRPPAAGFEDFAGRRTRPDIVVIDGDYIEVDPQSAPPRNRPSGWTSH
jgi:UPF0716 protein FxsA